MPLPGMLRRVALVRVDISEEHVSSIIRMERISELGTTFAVTSNCTTLPRNNNYMQREWDTYRTSRGRRVWAI
jgi:hypothetical protein